MQTIALLISIPLDVRFPIILHHRNELVYSYIALFKTESNHHKASWETHKNTLLSAFSYVF